MPKKPPATALIRDGIPPKAPGGLGRAGVTLWKAIHSEYQIDDQPSLEVLRSACECVDRAEAAKAEVQRDGMTASSATGSLRPHPALAVEAQFRGLMLRHLNNLGINAEPPRAPGRPPTKTVSPFHWNDA